jgi:hypothetical protein
MKLSLVTCLQILTLDAAVARSTQGPVEFVIMAFAVGRVVEDIELCCREGPTAGPTYETLLMVASSKATRGVLD